VRDNPAEHRFEIDLGGGELAIAAYHLERGTISFTHTVVPEAHEGRGVGSALARFALQSARERRLKVEPACSFFAQYMRRHQEVQDLLTPESRSHLNHP
jgi:predicted GNAT family acetyltransferase